MKTTVDVKTYYPKLKDIDSASKTISQVSQITPLQYNFNLSHQYDSNIYLKREDLQIVRSYKIRGAYNKIVSLKESERKKGIICASAGNHAQGVAFSCYKLKIKGIIYMPVTTPKQKVSQVKLFGKEYIEIILKGDSFDEAKKYALLKANEQQTLFIHPFDDPKVIEGDATIASEILQQIKEPIDYIFIPVGGGGLASGVGTVFKELSPNTKIIGVVPYGAPVMYQSIKQGKKIHIKKIDRFADGAAVHQVGAYTFSVCQKVLDDILLVPEGLLCKTILKRYNEDAMVIEPAGALSMAVLDLVKEEIVGKNVVCIVSGGNNDITRIKEIKERSLLYEGLKHYFIINFPQRAGALKKFVNYVLNDGDDITFFEYSKKNSREKGPAIIGIEIQNKKNFNLLINNLKHLGFDYEYINDKPKLFQYLI